MIKKYICLLASVFLLGGCAHIQDCLSGSKKYYEPVIVAQSMHSDIILTCLHETREMTEAEFSAAFAVAEENLPGGTEFHKLNLICLALNSKADYQHFLLGKKVFEQMVAEQPAPGQAILGLKFLVDRLDQEIGTRWSAWRTLIEEKKNLQNENESLHGSLELLRIKNEELQKKIEQLKNIEEIMKRRETGQL